jgi:hypothetical protein
MTRIATEYTAELTKLQPAQRRIHLAASAPWRKSPAPLGSPNPPRSKAACSAAPRSLPNPTAAEHLGSAIHIVICPSNQNLPFADMVRRADDAFLLHLLDQLGRLVVSDIQVPLDERG